MPHLTLKQWLYMLAGIILIDLLVFAGFVYYFAMLNPTPVVAQSTPMLLRPTFTPTPRATWAGPGPTVTPSPTIPPTPVATQMFVDGNFASEFIPTPRPREIANFNIDTNTLFRSLDLIALGRAGKIPIIDQLQYPEPFFPAGANNACGPVALYAGMQGLGAKFQYPYLRDIAVRNDFGAHGITVSGLVNTAVIMNQQLGSPFTIEQSRGYQLSDLTHLINQKAIVIVLVRVKKVNGNYQVTGDKNGSFGHFLVLESINTMTRRVRVAGSTLGMQNIPLDDFLASWASKPREPAFVRRTNISLNLFDMPSFELVERSAAKPTGIWALVIKRK
ncbi:hypothetical protein QUF64_15905 [Anaerolineales bacterium HSG6]|nr:hypothetical protein [Anaerolineales bacterium HSG6]MDM8532996.1 hypothetical protein [Anaerolineales bacterium HSG25]